MFRLTDEEARSLRCQIGTLDDLPGLRSQFATLEKGRGKHRKYLPYVFTEHGAIVAASVLNSERAVKASINVVRAFVALRRVLASHKELAHTLDKLERRIDRHDHEIAALLDAIRALMTPPPARRRKAIGFHPARARKRNA